MGSGAGGGVTAELLAQAGYTTVINMQGGFGGARDQMGRTLTPGWSSSRARATILWKSTTPSPSTGNLPDLKPPSVSFRCMLATNGMTRSSSFELFMFLL